jgi:hypothetical protein
MARKLLLVPSALALLALASTALLGATTAATYRGVMPVVRFDVSPPLRSITPLPVSEGAGALMVDPDSDLEGPLGPQTPDGALLQDWVSPIEIPAPLASFDGPSNTYGVAPPDPNGDVGPAHVVVMSNLSFAIYSKVGALLYGPAANNTLWSGFGGPCQTENAGDPVVLYDQWDDRWLLTQFTAAGPTYYNCVALSTSSDPTGSYYRWAVSTGTNFPDYPKYGIWGDGIYISTREFAASFAGVGAYAMNRAQMVAGNPAPTVIAFNTGTVPAYNMGDGLLPADVDGFLQSPQPADEIYLGSMDNGGPYGAPQDALTVWRFHTDFATPANSTFALVATVPIGAYDTIPAFCSGRACVPQPGTANKIDHLGYRQRPLHRAAYRNFGDHEAIVTNQSVEASATMSGIRWWELRDPNGTPTIYQEGTYAPGTTDGIHRWMGSIAQDSAGNMALGYSASDATSTFPSVWYTGRLAGDALGTMPAGEGSVINGTGSQTGGGSRWGDYTSTTVDPIDDCTFWMVNEYLPTTSSSGWRLRIGAFKFDECGSPDFYLNATPASQSVCAGSDADYTVNVGQISGFTNQVTLAASGNPGATTANFDVNPVTPPGTSTLTIGNTGGVGAGTYSVSVDGTASGSPGHSTSVDLTVFATAPGAATLDSPADGAMNVSRTPTFTWTGGAGAVTYAIEVATDNGFGNIVASASGLATETWTSDVTLDALTQYYWRVRGENSCGAGVDSAVFSFTTVPLPGECAPGSVPNALYTYGFEAGLSGWTSSGTGNTWAITTTAAYVHSGTQAMHATDPASTSDQRLVSPAIVLPSGQDPVVLEFWNSQSMESNGTACWDGGIVEITTNGGTTWTQIPGVSMLTDPYNGPFSGGNPLGTVDAWCGDPQAYLNSIVDVTSWAGQTVNFRFRLGSDSSVGRTDGWNLDDILVQSCTTDTMPFLDGFETGDTSRWSVTVP